MVALNGQFNGIYLHAAVSLGLILMIYFQIAASVYTQTVIPGVLVILFVIRGNWAGAGNSVGP